MLGMRNVVLCLLVLVLPSTAWADSPAPVVIDIPAGSDKIVPLKKGELVPYDGQLFDNPTALRWGNWLLQYKYRLVADVDLQKRLCEADTGLWSKKYELLDHRYKLVTEDYQKQIVLWQNEAAKYKQELENPPWYKSPFFHITLGVLFTGTAVGLGAYALHSATK